MVRVLELQYGMTDPENITKSYRTHKRHIESASCQKSPLVRSGGQAECVKHCVSAQCQQRAEARRFSLHCGVSVHEIAVACRFRGYFVRERDIFAREAEMRFKVGLRSTYKVGK